MKTSDLTPKQIARLTINVKDMLETLPNGCVVPRKRLVIYVDPARPSASLRTVAWMLAKGETAGRRMMATCRTVNCCNVDHLVYSDRRTRAEPKPVPGERSYTTREQQRRAYEMRQNPRNRLIDIAIALDLPIYRVYDAIRRERRLVEKRMTYLRTLKGKADEHV